MIATELITSIRNRMADQVDKSYDDALIIDFVNDGAREFASTTGCIQDEYTYTATENQKEFDLDETSMWWVNTYKVEVNGKEMDFCPPYEMAGWESDSGPTAYTNWGRKVTLNCNATVGDAVKVYFTRIPRAIVNAGDEIDFPTKWVTALKAYGEFRIRAADRDQGLADRAHTEYEAMRQAAAQINSAFLKGGYA